MGEKIRVVHPITRLIIGGAQENTMLTAELMNKGVVGNGRYDVSVISGPQTGPEGSLIEEVEKRGTRLTLMEQMRREISPVNDLAALWLLWRQFRREKPHIVHTHSSKAGVLGRLAAAYAGVPVIVHTVHGWSFHDRMGGRKLRLYVGLEKLAERYSQVSIVVSPKDIDKGLAQGIGQRDDYVVIRSGVEMDRFGHPQVAPAAMRAGLGIPAEALVVGSVTRLSPQKAPLDLVAAYAAIARQRPETWFVIVGDGPLRAEVEAAVAAVGLTERVVLTGLRRDVPELMAMFDLFVLSSLWEGLPRVLPQAMATGLPIVCTQADGSAEAVAEGENGYLVTRGEPLALAEKVLLLLGDEGLRGRMGAEGQKRAHEFSALKMVQDIDQLYKRLLRAKGLANLLDEA
ncbi:MAG TPA: glycosyltransferase family 4 protein [Anaerolineae bacterium]|nr:glycosyltransferase family 4 protein [Anaerolineae bacterium]